MLNNRVTDFRSTSWIKDLEELTVTQVDKEFTPFYGNCQFFRFIVNGISWGKKYLLLSAISETYTAASSINICCMITGR
jgi:hypothetical protein